MKIIRVFPRRTRATPVDQDAYIGDPDLFAEADEVHISVTFTWDLPEAERLEKAWRHVAPTKVGGPATGERGDMFVPGFYLRNGYVITSRGCPNQCWFCEVWKREGREIRELPVMHGWNVLDDNLLACSRDHIIEVFDMLKKQSMPIQFTGGLEAARLEQWMVDALKDLKPKQLFFAYDSDDDYDPLVEASRRLLDAGFTVQSHSLRCFVLCGYPKDTIDDARRRMIRVMDLGFTPMAMAWHDRDGKVDRPWRAFQREWARPAIIHTKVESWQK